MVSLIRTYSGRSRTRNPILRCLLIGSTLSPTAYFTTICGIPWRNSLISWLTGKNAKQSTICAYYPPTLFCGLLLIIVNRAISVPRWRGLNRFSNYLGVEFSDGSKWEDMSKVIHKQCSINSYYWLTFWLTYLRYAFWWCETLLSVMIQPAIFYAAFECMSS